jgi:hypothetical protein
MVTSKDSSPFDSSPLQQQRSPRMFWEDRASPSRFGSENSPERSEHTERSASPTGKTTVKTSGRQSSIENLKKASRVKNSTMYARETKHNYDPSSSPVIERPLSNRGWGGNFQNNVFTRFDSLRKENSPIKSPTDAEQSPSRIPGPSAGSSAANTSAPSSPRRESYSPTKSSLTSNSRFAASFESDQSHWPEDLDDERVATPRAQPRHAKSVTFETAPPEINEYEQQTPEPSSIASGSREGSYDSDEYDDNSFERASSVDEDSFDASLEDTDKTPVVLPEDWRHMSPDVARNHLANDYDDVFDHDDETTERNASISNNQQRPSSSRSESANSDAEARPLPPLPGMPSFRRTDSGGLAAAAERVSSIQRSLPSPPRPASVSKDEILRMREANMSMEDRMNLLKLQTSLSDMRKSQSAEEQVDEPIKSAEEDDAAATSEHSDVEDDDLAGFEFAPSISRESIMRNVKSQKYDQFDADLQEESMISFADRDYRELANLDPDVPIPSRETSTQFEPEIGAAIKEENENSYLDLSTVPSFHSEIDEAGADDYDRQSSVIHHAEYEEDSQVEDDESRYSSPMSVLISEHLEEPEHLSLQDDQESPGEDEVFATPLDIPQSIEESSNMGLPLSFLGSDDFDFGLKDFITPTPPSSADSQDKGNKSVLEPPEILQPSFTIEPQYGREGSTESDQTIGRESFGSVIHGSMIDMSPPPEEAPIIPERKATIKTQGKLKARPSGTPADLEAMRAQRRHVSNEVPPIPDQYRSEASTQADEYASSEEDEEEDGSHSSGSLSEHDITGQEPQTFANGEHDNDQSLQLDTTLDKDVQHGDDEPSDVRNTKLDLDFPIISSDNDMGLGMDAEFDRVIEAQKV